MIMKKMYRVFFRNGNQMIYEGVSMILVIKHIDTTAALNRDIEHSMGNIVKIEEIEKGR